MLLRHLILMAVVVLHSSAYLHRQQFTEIDGQQGYEKWLNPQHQNLVKNYSNVDILGLQGAEQRLFSIFDIVRIHNGPCSGSGESGVCYTASECLALGGRNIDTCAKGFGTCCYTEITCGGSTSANCTHLVSPNYPGTYNEARTCSMSFTRKSDICQLRLDFMDFQFSQPDNFGVCNEDLFTVPGERKFTYLCGNAPNNWHFYLDVNGKANPTVFNFQTSATSFNRKFKIKVSMIPCRYKVPCGCGQYFTENTGTIQSFNYGATYLAGLDYGICLRKEKNYCTTTLTTAGPSFISCPNDLFRQPVGQTGANIGVAALAIQALYCQLNVPNVGALAALGTMTSPQTSVTNGPFTIWHMTAIDNIPNFRSNAMCPSCAGFFRTFQRNPC